MSQDSNPPEDTGQEKARPFRRAVWRGLAIVTPPLLTIVVFLWMWNMIDSYVLQPIESIAEVAIVGVLNNSTKNRAEIQDSGLEILESEKDGNRAVDPETKVAEYKEFKGHWIPARIKDEVDDNPGKTEPTTVNAYYQRYARITFLRRIFTIPLFLLLFVLILSLVGRLMAVGVGNFTWGLFEQLINRVPIIRTVYSAAKQVTDFVFKEQEVEFTRVIAVQYPRQGVWSMGFVTGESFLDIRAEVKEPVLSVLMPTSPMPATGFTITVPKSETIDLDISVDQAIQFCVSCGVVVPSHQQYSNEEIAKQISAAFAKRESEEASNDGAAALPAPGAQQADGEDGSH